MPGYTEEEARAAVAASLSYSEVLRRLGLRAAGGNHKLLRRWIEVWQISTAHFDPGAGRTFPPRPPKPLSEVLVENSTYHRGHLKDRLYEEGIKRRQCELCGQGESWRGGVMALVLDHINGIPDDNRLENLRIVCPNCAATLETHCGRNRKLESGPRECLHCGKEFWPKRPSRRYCSARCGTHSRPRPGPRPRRARCFAPPTSNSRRTRSEQLPRRRPPLRRVRQRGAKVAEGLQTRGEGGSRWGCPRSERVIARPEIRLASWP